jgi:uncharacterized protein
MMSQSEKNENKPMKYLQGEKISVAKLPLDTTQEFSVDQSTPWVAEILEEICEGKSGVGELTVEFQVTRGQSSELDEYIWIAAEVDFQGHRTCVRCLEPTLKPGHLEFEACVLDANLENNELYQESETVVCQNREMELYFYEQRMVNLKQILHEQIFVHYDYYPLHAEDCKGLCPKTGRNLNYPTKKLQ